MIQDLIEWRMTSDIIMLNWIVVCYIGILLSLSLTFLPTRTYIFRHFRSAIEMLHCSALSSSNTVFALMLFLVWWKNSQNILKHFSASSGQNRQRPRFGGDPPGGLSAPLSESLFMEFQPRTKEMRPCSTFRCGITQSAIPFPLVFLFRLRDHLIQDSGSAEWPM